MKIFFDNFFTRLVPSDKKSMNKAWQIGSLLQYTTVSQNHYVKTKTSYFTVTLLESQI